MNEGAMIQLEYGVAVVTGAGGGIGRSIALSLANAGCNVVIADIDQQAASAVAEEIDALGRQSLAVQVDVSDKAAMEALADKTFERFGKTTVLVNNAGVTLRPFRAIWDTSDADFRWVMNVNFWGVLNGIQAFLPRMMAQEGTKHIVNTSSMSGLLDIAGHGAYSAAKAAVDGLSGSLRSELASHDIGVTLLFPGYIATRIATSERLRPADEQSDKRGVKPYSDYVADQQRKAGAINQVTGGEVASGSQASAQPIDVATVGPMVLDAILANRPYCFTHPAPETAIHARAARFLDAYHPPVSTR